VPPVRPSLIGRFLRCALLLLPLVLAVRPAHAAKEEPDTLYFKNGDRLIGDVDLLLLGEVTIDPPEMDKVNVKWEEIQRISTAKMWNIRTVDGRQYRGRFRRNAMSGMVSIATPTDTIMTKMSDVSYFTELKGHWMSRADGYLSFGLSYQNANELAQGTLSSRVNYNVGRERIELRQYSVRNFQPGVEDIRVDQVGLSWMHDVTGRWAVGPQIGYESNSELNIDQRYKASLLIANRVILHLRMSNILMAGDQGNLERSAEGEHTTENELFVGNRLQMNFLSHDLELRADTFANFGTTVKGRTRLLADVTFSAKVVGDWKLGIEFYDQYDSKPPDADEAINDFRVSNDGGLDLLACAPEYCVSRTVSACFSSRLADSMSRTALRWRTGPRRNLHSRRTQSSGHVAGVPPGARLFSTGNRP
jgi:hypothetical protein